VTVEDKEIRDAIEAAADSGDQAIADSIRELLAKEFFEHRLTGSTYAAECACGDWDPQYENHWDHLATALTPFIDTIYDIGHERGLLLAAGVSE